MELLGLILVLVSDLGRGVFALAPPKTWWLRRWQLAAILPLELAVLREKRGGLREGSIPSEVVQRVEEADSCRGFRADYQVEKGFQ